MGRNAEDNADLEGGHDGKSEEHEANRAEAPKGHTGEKYADIEKRLDGKIAMLEKKQVELTGQVKAMGVAVSKNATDVGQIVTEVQKIGATLDKNVSDVKQATALAAETKPSIDQLSLTTTGLAALMKSMQEAHRTMLDRLDTERANKAARKE